MIRFLLLALLLLVFAPVAPAADRVEDKLKEVSGTGEFLRGVPKHFATLEKVAGRNVTVRIEGENEAKTWPLIPDAEVRVAGWWGRAEDIKIGDRVWFWFYTNRAGEPTGISMLADEMSEQDIHDNSAKLKDRDGAKLTLEPGSGRVFTIDASGAEVRRGKEKVAPEKLPTSERVFVQRNNGKPRLVLDAAAFELRRAEQKQALRERWIKEGLPGTVTFLHPFSGEMEFVLDHEAIRWGRSLKPGDKVSLLTTKPIVAGVRSIKPWRDRTQLRLVVDGPDQGDLALGQRVGLKMETPAASVDESLFPPDMDRKRTKEERAEWFLATIYCPCKVMSNVCTGQFYTLSGCNVNACGMPNALKSEVLEQIELGKTDRQILEKLVKDYGPGVLKSHLIP